MGSVNITSSNSVRSIASVLYPVSSLQPYILPVSPPSHVRACTDVAPCIFFEHHLQGT